jgi:hypothetical protein
MVPQAAPVQPQQQPEIVDGNIILYRSPHFALRTAYRPGARPAQRANPQYRPTGHTRMLPKVMPHQGDRIANSETRLMPRVEMPGTGKKQWKVPVPRWLEVVVITLGLLLALVAHAYNMFNYPRYELDEGTYMASAWAILNNMISPYAYGYGHPPLAWIQLAGFVPLMGGFFAFDNAINTGRVIMLFYAVGSALLVYLSTYHLTGSRAAGLLAMMLFSLSPLAITYQRQIYLDNIATFWLLLSLYLLVSGESNLRKIVFSAVALGMSILSKEVFVLFLPGMIYGVWLHTTKFQRKFGLVAFSYTVLAVCSTFVLMAALKGELFPSGWLPWDQSKHLSLIDTYVSQAKRGSNEGGFAQSWGHWMRGDWVLIVGGVVAPLFNLVTGWWNRKRLFIACLALSFWALLVRGGVVLTFYIIPLIPLIAINMVFAVQTAVKWLGKLFYFDLMRAILLLFIVIVLVPFSIVRGDFNYELHPTSIQNKALNWMRKNAPRNAVVITSNYMWLDLTLPGGQGVGNNAAFSNAYMYDVAGSDPSIYDTILLNNWDRIDYFIADSQMLAYITGNPQAMPANKDLGDGSNSMEQNQQKILFNAFKRSQMVAFFQTQDHDEKFDLKIFQVQHKSPMPQVKLSQENGRDILAGGPMPIDRRFIYTIV